MREVQLRKSRFSLYETILLAACAVIALLMLVRVFYGTELTDEAFYVSNTMAMMRGNVPYVYGSFGFGTGGTFLLIPFLFVYGLFVPDDAGIFLFSRICFMLFWWLTVAVGYRFLKKDFKRSSALLVSVFMLAFAGGGQGLYNFSYNTTPLAVTYMAGLIIYDAVEHKSKRSPLKLVLAGFLMGIAFLGHAGYAVAILTFAIVIVIRTEGIKGKILNVVCCVAGGLLELAVVFIPIIAQTSLPAVLDGTRMYWKPVWKPLALGYIRDITTSKLAEVAGLFGMIIPCFIVAVAVAYALSTRYIRENEKKLEKSGYAALAVSAVVVALVLLFARLQVRATASSDNWYWGAIAVLGIPALFCLRKHRGHPVLLYMGIYPIVYSFGEILFVTNSTSLSRLSYAAPALAIYFLVILNEVGELARLLAAVAVATCTMAMMVNNYRYVYRDGHFAKLTSVVKSGVYKGIRTTGERARDLPELEEYLNKVIAGGEPYAFRDNVPAGYLMARAGTMCDKSTWDSMNYAYLADNNRDIYDNPMALYAYYQKRGMFPKKYIYVEYGSYDKLSIDDDGYKFSEFVRGCYEKTADFALNATFRRVVVYEYKGGFDGNFGPWTERDKLR